MKGIKSHMVKWKRAEDVATFLLIKKGIRIKDLQHISDIGELSPKLIKKGTK